MSGLWDPSFVQGQYRQPGHLQSRIDLHERFSTNPYGWQRWVLDHLQLASHARVLEVGCGPGGLWCDNLDRIPVGWEVMVSDWSQGMVQKTRKRLLGSGRQWPSLRVDAMAIPFDAGSVDAVVANHMLYHVPDLPRALDEVCRVLRTGGRFFASTVGEGHLKELQDSLVRFDASLGHWGGGPYQSFHLDNGQEILERWFGDVELCEYEDALQVTEAQALADYVLSSLDSTDEGRSALIRWFDGDLARGGGSMRIRKRSGLFCATRR